MSPADPRSSKSGFPRFAVVWGPVVLYAAAIFVESSISQVPAFPSNFSDKDGHALLYAGLAVLTARATCEADWRRATFWTTAAAVACAAAYGASDEFHQWFVPGRTADPADWVADLLGASAGAGLALLAAKAWASRQKR